MANVYAVSFSSKSATAVAKDLFELTPSTSTRIRIREIQFGQHSASAGSSMSGLQFVGISLHRGSTVAATGGSTGTPVPVDGRARTSVTAVTLSASSPGSSGPAAALLYAGSWNIFERFVYRPKWDERFVSGLGERIQVRMSAPSATLTMDGTIVFEEIGKTPGE